MMRVPAGIQRHANAPFPWMLELRTVNGLGRATPPGPFRRRGLRSFEPPGLVPFFFLRVANDRSSRACECSRRREMAGAPR
jgi:hypothetical protein